MAYWLNQVVENWYPPWMKMAREFVIVPTGSCRSISIDLCEVDEVLYIDGSITKPSATDMPLKMSALEAVRL